MKRHPFRSVGLVLMLCALNSAWAAPAADLAAPSVDHHQHLLSPQGAALLNAPDLATDVPADVSALLLAHEAAWDDAARLALLYADDAVALDVNDNRWIQGKDAVAAHMSKRFARPYNILPLAWRRDGDSAVLSALYSRGEGSDRRNVGSVAMRLVQENGTWRIAMEYPVFPGPVLQQPLDAERLIALLDAAGIRRAAVLSVAYWFQSPMYKVDDPVRGVRDENAWTAAQAARYPDRLVAFCSLNPISDAALELLRECVGDGRFKGLKLHFGNANIDLTNPDHLRRVRAVFAAANAARLAIVVHARGGDEYDARHARIFVEQLLPAAPDVPVQMAHLWGGAQFAPEALAVYAEAIEAGKPATGRFIFDVSDAAFAARTPELAQLIATRMRQIGMDRMYYGSDAAFDGHADPATSWQTFRKGLPLTDAEFLQIQSNVAPYMDQ
jgi:predicted TIM-barrel fold metal-dependent hydrolase